MARTEDAPSPAASDPVDSILKREDGPEKVLPGRRPLLPLPVDVREKEGGGGGEINNLSREIEHETAGISF